MSTMDASTLGAGLAIPPEPVARLSVASYHALQEAGVLGDAEPIELLEGWLVPKMTKRPPHRAATRLVQEALARRAPSAGFVDSQEPITLDDSEPEPDVSVVRGRPRDYAARHPLAHEVWLVVEVADTSLERDRGWKRRLYARAALPAYWIVNLVERCVEVHSDPTGPAEAPDYRERRVYGEADVVPLVIDGVACGELPVAELLP